MIVFPWLAIVCYTFIMLELIMGSWNLIFPGYLCFSFYLMVSYDKVTGILGGAFAGVIVEIILGREYTSLPLLLPMMLYAEWWRNTLDRRYLSYQSISGLLIGLGYGLYLLLIENRNLDLLSGQNILFWLPSLTGNAVLSFILFPLLLVLIDKISYYIGAKRFRAKHRVAYYEHD